MRVGRLVFKSNSQCILVTNENRSNAGDVLLFWLCVAVGTSWSVFLIIVVVIII